MKLDEIVAWYQKKIGTYDKQQWEKTVEQRILDGFSSVSLKTAKLKPELIDVDLVRGSTFPKAKPKQSLLTVIRYAILRYLFLPVYAQWWVKQTSSNIFAILLLLYITQMINWAVYTFNIHRLHPYNAEEIYKNTSLVKNASTVGDSKQQVEEHIVGLSELLIPMGLSLLLSLIHSQIVATNSASGSKTKRRRFSNASQNSRQSREAKPRRRKKLVKNRSQDSIDASTQKRKLNIVKKVHSCVEESMTTNVPSESTNMTGAFFNNASENCSTSAYATSLKLDLNKSIPSSNINATCSSIDCFTDNHSNSMLQKKRNVNWHSPIHNFAIETKEQQQQTSPQSMSSTTTSEANTPNNAVVADDDVNDSSSCCSSSASSTQNQSVRIDECVLEFYDDLITGTDLILSDKTSSSTSTITNTVTPTYSRDSVAAHSHNAVHTRRIVGDDDGFESLNGKSSSEEANCPTPSTSAAAINHLRLRKNTENYQGGNCVPQNNAELLMPTAYRRKMPLSSESDYDKRCAAAPTSCETYAYQPKAKSQLRAQEISTEETDEEDDDCVTLSTPASMGNNSSNYNECTTSATEWLGITTNSDECSYSSDMNNSDNFKNAQMSDENGYDVDISPAIILNAHGSTDRISCTIWDKYEIKKASMSVLEISSCIIERVESMPETNDYIYFGIFFSVVLSLIPSFCRLCGSTLDSDKSGELNYLDVPKITMLLWQKASFAFFPIFSSAFGQANWERTVLIIGFMQRLCLTLILFTIFAVAERTFKQRFLYAKLFSHVTSSRRARKSNLPHFRLNKVRNIKTWLSVRAYLKKRGPQRSVDVIVSAAFLITLLLLAFLSVEWLKEDTYSHSHLNLEALMWSTTIGIFLLRFMTLGNKIYEKYRSISVLITEQINLYLQIEQKPKKKDELMVSNSVLKLAADLLKELESPFKISGLSANPYLFTTIKVVILSALSGVLSEMLGFKLKLHKIKIK